MRIYSKRFIFSCFKNLLLALGLAYPSYLWADSNELNFVTLQHAPYGFLSETGDKRGYLYDLTNVLRKEAGFHGTHEIVPTLRVFSELEEGSAHCSVLARVPVPDARYEKLAPIGKSITVSAIPRKPIILNNYSDLAGKKIGVPRGVFVGEPFDSDDTLLKVPTKNYDLSSAMFKSGRVDVVIGAYDSMLFNMRKMGVDLSEIGQAYVFKTVEFWLMCQPGKVTTAQKKRLVEATDKLRESGTIKRIIDKYLQPDSTS
ncbi:substrate-binding periplasmic protein [Kiloniella litopenaei]|uniref:substrate-binding periplasmic protein n=1 Tax=Kiloniella litopenaei TaxID=1549748 RepID=UPI003BA8DF40